MKKAASIVKIPTLRLSPATTLQAIGNKAKRAAAIAAVEKISTSTILPRFGSSVPPRTRLFLCAEVRSVNLESGVTQYVDILFKK